MEILPLATMFKFFYYPNFIFNWIQKKTTTNKQTKQTVATTALCISSAFPYLFYLRETYLYEVMVFKKKKVNQITLQYQSSCFECFLYWSFIVTLHHRNSSYDLDRRKFKPRAGRLKASNKCTAGMNALEWMHLKK